MEVEANSQTQIVSSDRRPDALGDFNLLSDEIVCSILNLLSPRDVACLACASSVMYILCNEEPLWMNLCLSKENRNLQYKGSWKRTTLHRLQVLNKYDDSCKKPLHFDGFNSLFLYKRFYRCYTRLDGFAFDQGNVERKTDLSPDEFLQQYDGQKPVLVPCLAETWMARKTWTPEQLLIKYGDTSFRISQRSANKVSMKLKDYVSYMQEQHDEDPLYIFEDKFGEVAPDLLKDYSVPHLFPDDYFDVLDNDQRPPFRWLIIGPERSGASWHVDPALTSAWNTLLCGRKRWALYPPGRVPLGVTVHVNDEDGDVDIETPSSLQWWLDFYPLLADEDKPIECTQLPGETIYVPTGWWHCVLNLETTIAVTQNYVNSKNFEFVCLDLAPGYQHKGVCRAGLLALEENAKVSMEEDNLISSELTRKKKKVKIDEHMDDLSFDRNGSDLEFSYDINFLKMFLDKNRDHYTSLWSTSNCIGQRELRDWLWKLWIGKPGLRDLIWKGACIALNTNKWYKCMEELCSFHNISLPADEEKFPVGTGSNPVYLVGDNVVKIFVEDGLQACLHALGTELEFYGIMQTSESSLKNHVPNVLASGIVFFENGSYKIMPWDGKGVPDVITKHSTIDDVFPDTEYPFGIWSKKLFEYKKAGMPLEELVSLGGHSNIWPYIITKRCKGKIFAELRDVLPEEEVSDLASFLGKQLHHLHVLPVTPLNDLSYRHFEKKLEMAHDNGTIDNSIQNINLPAASKVFFTILNRKKKDVSSRLTKWGHPIPSTLIEKVNEYLPKDFVELHNMFKNEDGQFVVHNCCSWVHTDIMDDNIHLEQVKESWRPSYIYDFSNMSLGDPILDLIPIHLDIFRGDVQLLKKLLESYKLPFGKRRSSDDGCKVRRISYLTMCYCIIHEENILGAIFGMSKELRTANSWEEVEEAVWGDLNKYY
ncbi:putative transcription factor & chromatin remodeling &Metalloenzymes JmjC family [Helianthus annuus]|nr:putative transcription factor & chromatin remodeling &Metalloenzymes JmjC family [Helianthus annuus]